MPSRILSFETPLNKLQSAFPTSHIESNLPLRVFGCTAFVHIHQSSKLAPRATKCIFLGYSATQKGYKCFDPLSKQSFVSLDVTFHENTPVYPNSSIQGESLGESQTWEPEPSRELMLLETLPSLPETPLSEPSPASKTTPSPSSPPKAPPSSPTSSLMPKIEENWGRCRKTAKGRIVSLHSKEERKR